MNRRMFFKRTMSGAASVGLSRRLAEAAPPPSPAAESDLEITGVKVVKTRPKTPVPIYDPAPNSWWVHRTAARPMSVYPEYNGPQDLWMADPNSPGVGPITIEIETSKGIKGYGRGGPGGGPVAREHLPKLLIGKNPLDIERLWDIMWRSTMYYGRKGAVVHAISGVDLALWDIAGKAWGLPVYRLLGGETKGRIPCYATGNDFDQSIEFGFKKVKLALPYGPAEGREGIRKNVELVRRVRQAIGEDGEVMLDCWMALTERYTLELAEAVAPYRVYWIEEALIPDDYEGYGRLRESIRSTRIVTGEHLYTRYGFRRLLEVNGAEIWQPDINWCGGLTEMRRIGAIASAYDIPVIPHAGGLGEGIHYIMATPQSPWAELAMPVPGGPKEVYDRWAEEKNITRGPEGIYMRPSERPGFGWDFFVS